MKTFTVVPVNGDAFTIKADKIGSCTNEAVRMEDTAGRPVAVISIKNIAAIFEGDGLPR